VIWPIRSISLGVNGPWVVAFWIGLALAAALAIWAYRAPVPPLPRASRIVLGMLRFLALGLLVFAIFQPVVTVASRGDERPLLAVLLDRSASMNLPADAKGDSTRRIQAAARLLGELAPALEREFDVRAYGFGAGLGEIAREEGKPAGEIAATEGATALGPALSELLAERERRPLAVVLLSDGGANAGSDPVTIAERGGVPVVAVPASLDSTVIDAHIAECLANRTAQLGQETAVQVAIESELALATRATLVLAGESGVIAREPVTLPAGPGRTTVTLRFRPERLGMHRYSVALEGVPGELTPANNRRAFALKVVEERMQVLLIADQLSWDVTFLRRTLAQDRGFALTTLVKLGAESAAYRPIGAGKLGQLPAKAAELAPFDCVILAGISATGLPQAARQAVRAYAERGGGVMVVAGPGARPLRAYEPGGPLAGLLPVRPQARPADPELVQPRLTPAGLLHPVTSLGETGALADQLWRELPPVATGQPLSSSLAGDVLVSGGSAATPLVVAGRMAAGRTLLVNTSLAWRWSFLVGGTQGNDTVHRRFWSDGVRWLAEGKSGGQLEIFADQASFLRGRQVTLGARLTGDDLEPIGDAEIKVQLVPVAGSGEGGSAGAGAEPHEVALASSGGNGQYAGAADPALPPGFYRLRGTAVRGERRWTAEGDPFLVDEAGLEGLTPAADPALLRRIAEASNGAFVAPEDAARAILKTAREELAVVRTREIKLWNHAGLFLAFVGCVSVEWFLRRRRGLA
jgi:hypothetical protein